MFFYTHSVKKNYYKNEDLNNKNPLIFDTQYIYTLSFNNIYRKYIDTVFNYYDIGPILNNRAHLKPFIES